ncbi:MAG: T9SS type A sorting domain-containing protein [Bacteroidota bacterium]|nr:T9SS type A sorting domain-containing protein [Bacteroidota bacterium]MDP4197332.1 T9SS type A sorting domain-containing protein [Bacteroidota bacterium]
MRTKIFILWILFSFVLTISCGNLFAEYYENYAEIHDFTIKGYMSGSSRIIDRPFAISVEINTQGYTDIDKPAEIALNFSNYFSTYKITQSFDDNSIILVETDKAGTLIDSAVVFQFDKSPNYNQQTNASGTLIFLLKGTTEPNTTRYFQIHFDTTGSKYYPPQFSSSLSITDNIMHAGQLSYKISDGINATFYFQKQGAGFASIIDKDGKDWVNYSTNTQNEQYRGIPNLGVCGHPGYPLPGDPSTLGSTSTIISEGPLKIKIRSITSDNNWEFTWEFYPNFATMTMLKNGGNYWFLYEGVPYGNLDLNSGYTVRNTRSRLPASQSWTMGILPSPKWVYFGDTRVKRTLFLAMHEMDNHNDYYRPLIASQDPANMTVFGFGRQDPVQPSGHLLTIVPAHFTIGFVDDTTFSTISRIVNSDISALGITIKYTPPRLNIPQSPVLISPINNSERVPIDSPFLWDNSQNAEAYQFQASVNSSFDSGLIDSLGIKDTVYKPGNLIDGQLYYWRVRAINNSGRSDFSETRDFITKLNKPDQLQATYVPPYHIQLKWVNNSLAAPGFIVERKDSVSDYQKLDTTNSNITFYNDTTTVPGVSYTYRVRAINRLALSDYSNTVQISYNITSTENKGNMITDYTLSQNFPNPFNPSTRISYSLPKESNVKIRVYDIEGRELRAFDFKNQKSGIYNVFFNSSGLTSGVYFYGITCEAVDGSKLYKAVKKMIFIK